MQWQPRLGLAKETHTEDEVARGWRYRQPLLVRSDSEPMTEQLRVIGRRLTESDIVRRRERSKREQWRLRGQLTLLAAIVFFLTVALVRFFQ